MLNSTHVRYFLGILVTIVHFISIAILATHGSKFNGDTELISVILVLSPVTLIYAISFGKYVMANADKVIFEGNEEKYNYLAVITMCLFSLMFCGSLLFVVWNFVWGTGYNLENFKMWISAIETAFGGLIALVFERLFGTRIMPDSDAPGKPADEPLEPKRSR